MPENDSSTDLSRDAQGRFIAGNAGGPGRPRKSSSGTVPARVLKELAKPPDVNSLYFMAKEIQELDAEIEKLRSSFPQNIVSQIETRVAISRLAMRKLVELLMGE